MDAQVEALLHLPSAKDDGAEHSRVVRQAVFRRRNAILFRLPEYQRFRELLGQSQAWWDREGDRRRGGSPLDPKGWEKENPDAARELRELGDLLADLSDRLDRDLTADEEQRHDERAQQVIAESAGNGGQP